MDDKEIVHRISELAAEEQRLDELWDLLRQRRAKRSAGQDPDSAEVRTAETVEKYLQ